MGYLLVVPLLLFIPLWYPHKAMQQYKCKLLNEISERLLQISAEGIKNIHSEEIEQITSNILWEKKLIEQYELLEKQIPAWPIAIQSIRNFSITAMIPAVVGLIPVVVDLVKLMG